MANGVIFRILCCGDALLINIVSFLTFEIRIYLERSFFKISILFYSGPKYDEDKYDELLAQRKDRKAGEALFDFLERQVKDQMRTAIG